MLSADTGETKTRKFSQLIFRLMSKGTFLFYDTEFRIVCYVVVVAWYRTYIYDNHEVTTVTWDFLPKVIFLK